MNEHTDRLDTILKLFELGFWDFDPNARILNWSPKAKEFFGLTPDAEVTYEIFLNGLHPDDRNRIDDIVRNAISTVGGEYKIEYRTIGFNDGIERIIESSGKVSHDPKGHPLRLIGVSRDVTQLRQHQKHCMAGWQAAERASQAKTQFVANMSHEMRTPLGLMIGFADLALDPDQTNEEREKALRTIKRNGEELLKLINEVLDLSKIEADRIEIEKVQFELTALIDDVVDVMKIRAREKGLSLSAKSIGKVPKFLCADPTRFRQILLNLVGNAIKFTEKGYVDLLIRAKKLVSGQPIELEIEVRDTGIGISKDQQKKLFKTFTQADSSMTRKYGGSGLGLALSKKLAQALHGDLQLKESDPGKGSSFSFHVTDRAYSEETALAEIRADPKLTPEGQSEKQRSQAKQVDLNGVKVLLVEDAKDNQVLVSRYLQAAGAHVDVAENGFQAVTMAENGSYDVVLMDIQMPVLNGYEATEKLRTDGYKRPIIALTAHAMRGEKEHCLEVGFDDHLTKPVDRTLLLEEVAQFADR